MGDAKAGPGRLSFKPQLRVEFHGATATSDAGLLLPRELDERSGVPRIVLGANVGDLGEKRSCPNVRKSRPLP